MTVFRKYSLPSLVGPSIGEPLLYLLGLGFGLGALVGTVGGLRYVEFVAPGMVMSSAMFAAAYECTYGRTSAWSIRRPTRPSSSHP
jgi:lipooligosaccharide transport system permease protein